MSFKIPIRINTKEELYLKLLVKNGIELNIPKVNGQFKMIARIYLDLEHSVKPELSKKYIESKFNITTTNIRDLLDKGYLIPSKNKDNYIPHDIFKYRYLNNHQKVAKIVTSNNTLYIKNVDDKDVKDFNVRKGTLDDLKSKNIITKIIVELFKNGLPTKGVFSYLDNAMEIKYFYLNDTKQEIIVLSPKLSKPKKIDVKFTINNKVVSIHSEATSFVNITKKDLPEFNIIKSEYINMVRELQENKVRFKNKAEITDFMNNTNLEINYLEYCLEVKNQFSKIKMLSENLVKKGIYVGGFNNNPDYKTVWDLCNNYHKLINNYPNIKRLLEIYNKAKDINTNYSKQDLENLNSINL